MSISLISSNETSGVLLSLALAILCLTGVSILLAMGLRLNVAQWTYRLCGAMFLLVIFVLIVQMLVYVASEVATDPVGVFLRVTIIMTLNVVLVVFILVPLLLPMNSKTLNLLRPISIVTVKASPHV